MARLKIGRKTQVIDCRETAGLGLGGGLAQRDTFSEAEEPDVIVLSMGPSGRHITKPVCEITYGLREEGIQTNTWALQCQRVNNRINYWYRHILLRIGCW